MSKYIDLTFSPTAVYQCEGLCFNLIPSSQQDFCFSPDRKAVELNVLTVQIWIMTHVRARCQRCLHPCFIVAFQPSLTIHFLKLNKWLKHIDRMRKVHHKMCAMRMGTHNFIWKLPLNYKNSKQSIFNWQLCHFIQDRFTLLQQSGFSFLSLKVYGGKSNQLPSFLQVRSTK